MANPSTEGYAPEWLQLEAALGTRPLLSGDASSILAQFTSLTTLLASQLPPPDPIITVLTKTIPTNSYSLPIRIYTPPNPTNAPLPLGVYFHGGGYVVGNLDSEDAWCRYIAQNSPCVIVSVDYRLGPEWKLPVMLEDCVAGFEWAYENAESLGSSKSNIFTIGCSAGGGLALTVAHTLLSTSRRSQIRGIVAIVPVTAHPNNIPPALKPHYTAYVENGSNVPIIDADTMDTFFKTVEADFNDPGTFVTLSPHLSDFPPTYISTCGKDPLRDDGKVLDMMLTKNGVPTKSDYYHGVPHYFWMFPGIKGGEEFLANVCEGVRFVLGA